MMKTIWLSKDIRSWELPTLTFLIIRDEEVFYVTDIILSMLVLSSSQLQKKNLNYPLSGKRQCV